MKENKYLNNFELKDMSETQENFNSENNYNDDRSNNEINISHYHNNNYNTNIDYNDTSNNHIKGKEIFTKENILKSAMKKKKNNSDVNEALISKERNICNPESVGVIFIFLLNLNYYFYLNYFSINRYVIEYIYFSSLFLHHTHI